MAASITTRRRLRVVTSLEHRYPEFDGLNLTWESLEGIVKHNGPLTDRERRRSDATATRHSGRHRRIRQDATISSCGALPRWRRRSPRSPTTSPMTPTTSTTVCAPACSRVDDLKVMPLTAEMIARDRRALSRPRRGPARRRTGARADFLSDRLGRSRRRTSGSMRRSRNRPRTSGITTGADRVSA